MNTCDLSRNLRDIAREGYPCWARFTINRVSLHLKPVLNQHEKDIQYNIV